VTREGEGAANISHKKKNKRSTQVKNMPDYQGANWELGPVGSAPGGKKRQNESVGRTAKQKGDWIRKRRLGRKEKPKLFLKWRLWGGADPHCPKNWEQGE